MKRVLVYKRFERFWHWMQALLIIILALTGFEIHGSFKLLGFETAVKVHDIALWAFLIWFLDMRIWSRPNRLNGNKRGLLPLTDVDIMGRAIGSPHRC
jgi:divalent metal cation (Fe/Co/Zn/Cd) transporter